MILTPEQIEQIAYNLEWNPGGDWLTDVAQIDLAHTLAAYAEVVKGVAEAPLGTNQAWRCPLCGRVFDDTSPNEAHASDCLYVKARKLRGLE